MYGKFSEFTFDFSADGQLYKQWVLQHKSHNAYLFQLNLCQQQITGTSGLFP